MASSPKIVCFHCEEVGFTLDHFKNGWELRSGEYAQLCRRCASAYEDGRFCETFHSNEEGWTDCETCGKLVHCGCIISANAYSLLDFGGIICTECTAINLLLEQKRCLDLESHPDMIKQNMIEPEYRPRITDAELQGIPKPYGSVVTALFEKKLSASDADPILSRLILPVRCAEVFIPDIFEPRGLPIKISDTEGKEWEANFRYRINDGSKIYIVEGLRELMISKEWRAGDTVTFFKVEPSGKLIIGLRKTSVIPSSNEARNSKEAIN